MKCMDWCSMPPTRYPNTVTCHGISIIGGGRLGRSLGRSLRERGWKIHSVVTRSQATARRAVRSIGGGHALPRRLAVQLPTRVNVDLRQHSQLFRSLNSKTSSRVM